MGQDFQQPDLGLGGQIVFDENPLDPRVERVGVGQGQQQKGGRRRQDDDNGADAEPDQPGT